MTIYVSTAPGPLERAIRAIPGWLSQREGDCRCPACGAYHPPHVLPPVRPALPESGL
ncbi:MAG: hypothetical protein ABSE66_09895 [Thermoplasmata archaeon]